MNMARGVWGRGVVMASLLAGCAGGEQAQRGPKGLDGAEAAQGGYYLEQQPASPRVAPASEEVALCDGGDRAACRRAGDLYVQGERVALDAARAEALFMRGCELGDAESCYRAGLVRRAAEGDDAVVTRGLYERACEGGVAGACTNLGAMTMRGEGGAQDRARGAALYARACEGGDAVGCANLGSFVRSKEGGEDAARARGLYVQSCELGRGDACGEAALMHDEGQGGAVDDVRARALYGRACELEVGQACNNLGAMYEHGEGGVTDRVEAIKLYTRACELEDGVGCRNVGLMLIGGDTEQQRQLGARSLAMACKRDDMIGCVVLGQCAEEGKGLDKDLELALRLYSYACDAGHARGCFAAGVFVDDARDGGTRDAERALALYSKACEASELRGCYNAGWMLERADGVPADVPRALTFYERACTAEFSNGCVGATKLYRTRGRADDLARARELLGQLCAADRAEACEELGQMWEAGQGGARDAREAGKARARACALGHKESCDKL